MTHAHHRYLNTTWCQPKTNTMHYTAMWCHRAQADVDDKGDGLLPLELHSLIAEHNKAVFTYSLRLCYDLRFVRRRHLVNERAFLRCYQITWLSGFSLLLNNTPQQVPTWPTWFGLICYVFALLLGKWKQQLEPLAHQAERHRRWKPKHTLQWWLNWLDHEICVRLYDCDPLQTPCPWFLQGKKRLPQQSHCSRKGLIISPEEFLFFTV